MRRLLMGLVAALMPALALAQTPAPLSLTLDDAIARGLAAAPRIAAARSREAAASAVVDSRSASGRPAVSASAGYLRTNHIPPFGVVGSDGNFRAIFPDIPNNLQAKGEIDVPIYTAGRVDAQVAAAKQDVTAAHADRQTTEADLRLDVAVAYWNLVTAREFAKVLEESLARADASVSDVSARVTTGFLPPSDLLNAQAQRARQSVSLIQARHAAALAEINLARLVGASLDQPIVTTSAIGQPDARAAEAERVAVADLVARAAKGRPDRDALLARAASLDATAVAARASLRPTLFGYGAVQPARPNQLFVPRVDEFKTSWNLGINMNWSLWDAGKSKADAAAATAQADALRHQLDDVDLAIGVDVRTRLLDLDADRAAIAAAGEAVRAATEAHRVVTERFRAGVATSTDVLDAQVSLLESTLEQTRFSVAARVDEARLLHAIGVH